MGDITAKGQPPMTGDSEQNVILDDKAKKNRAPHAPSYGGRTQREKAIHSASTFLFEVSFWGKREDLTGGDRSVIVEVELDSMAHLPVPGPSGEYARKFAEELAPEVAIQVVQKDLPHGFEPPYSVAQMDKLPYHLRNCPPRFQGSQFRAWLLQEPKR